MLDDRKRWIDAIFKLIEYRRTLESLMNPDAEVFDMAVQAMRRQAPEKPKKGIGLDRYLLQVLLPRVRYVFWPEREKGCFSFQETAIL